jgi:hypothetical protein
MATHGLSLQNPYLSFVSTCRLIQHQEPKRKAGSVTQHAVLTVSKSFSNRIHGPYYDLRWTSRATFSSIMRTEPDSISTAAPAGAQQTDSSRDGPQQTHQNSVPAPEDLQADVPSTRCKVCYLIHAEVLTLHDALALFLAILPR